jgi:hypothetical protein
MANYIEDEMDQNILNSVIEKGLDAVFKDSDNISFAMLSKAGLPQKILQQLQQQGRTIIQQKLDKLLDHPLFDNKNKDAQEDSIFEALNNLLERKLVFSKEFVSNALISNYQNLLSDWQKNPLVFTGEPENLASNAGEILKRSAILSGVPENSPEFTSEMISAVCGISGLPLIANAIEVERQLGVEKMNLQQFTVLIRRSLMLKDQLGVSATSPQARPAPKVEAKPIPAPTPAPKPIPTPPPPAPPKPAPTPSAPKVEIPKAPSERRAKETAPPAPVPKYKEGETLENILLSAENLEYFAENLYDGDVVKYRSFVDKVCQQDNIKHAFTETSNELYYLDIPEASEVAVKFKKVIEQYYKG